MDCRTVGYQMVHGHTSYKDDNLAKSATSSSFVTKITSPIADATETKILDS